MHDWLLAVVCMTTFTKLNCSSHLVTHLWVSEWYTSQAQHALFHCSSKGPDHSTYLQLCHLLQYSLQEASIVCLCLLKLQHTGSQCKIQEYINAENKLPSLVVRVDLGDEMWTLANPNPQAQQKNRTVIGPKATYLRGSSYCKHC